MKLGIDISGEKKPKFVHIAGTNGKGTVSLKTAIGLSHGFKGSKVIGLFTSPHILSFCERIAVY